ncbi:HAD-like domain-containing protein [Mycena polygramma]|nr:HAD-like domain-containing protein [Mycena polygramma]
MDSDLRNVQVLLFDIFGTTVDWHGSLVEELGRLGRKHDCLDENWSDFSKSWRLGYMDHIGEISRGGTRIVPWDELHRGVLEHILQSPEWKHFGAVLNEEEREHLNNVWHRLHGWPDATAGIYALKKQKIVGALSNGNTRLLVDLAKATDLPWDVVFSSEMFDSLKPDPKVYQGAMKHLSVDPQNCALVAAHLWDLRGASSAGMKTIYVTRAAEEPVDEGEVKPKSEGGEVDLVVGSFTELAAIFSDGK